MPMQVKVLILRAPGTNCDEETAFAFQRAGGQPQIMHVARALENPKLLNDFQILCIPGGFSYGDDIASGRILGVQLQHHLADGLRNFKAAGKLILGICNGFQVLVKCRLLDDTDGGAAPLATLGWNASGKFEHRWVQLAVDGNKCVFLAGIQTMYVPVKHGEGRFVARDQATLDKLAREGRLPLRYVPLPQPVSAQGAYASDAADQKTIKFDQPVPYPDNPNGAQANVAGMCDSTGRVFGLMPHPELNVDPLHHPRWSRGEAPAVGDGLRLFQNAVQFFR
jgi:phosphoribosylformylglycinamidine synthase subunit PurQ / glutaminase